MIRGEYGSDVVWVAGEIDAYRRYNALCRDQALAIYAWDRNQLAGKVQGPRPVSVPAAELARRAREQIQ